GRDVAHPDRREQPPPFGYCPARPGEAHHAQEMERVPVEHELGAPAAAPLSPGETVEPGLELLIVEEVLARNGAADGIYALTEVKVAHHDDAIGRGERLGRGVHVSDRGGPPVHLCTGSEAVSLHRRRLRVWLSRRSRGLREPLRFVLMPLCGALQCARLTTPRRRM